MNVIQLVKDRIKKKRLINLSINKPFPSSGNMEPFAVSNSYYTFKNLNSKLDKIIGRIRNARKQI